MGIVAVDAKMPQGPSFPAGERKDEIEPVFVSLLSPRAMWQLEVVNFYFPGISFPTMGLFLLRTEWLHQAIENYDGAAYEGTNFWTDIFWRFCESGDYKLYFNLPNKFGMYAIHEVVRYRKEDLISPVLDRTSDMYVKNFDGLTAFHCAARDGFLQLFKGWEKGSVDFNVRDSRGRTPMSHAMECGQQEVVYFLRKNGGTL